MKSVSKSQVKVHEELSGLETLMEGLSEDDGDA